MIITRADLHDIRYCFKGARKFFAKHSLDWQDFVKNGIEAEKLLATKDAMADKLVNHTYEKRVNNG